MKAVTCKSCGSQALDIWLRCHQCDALLSDGASEAQPPKEVSPSAQGCRDANASSNPKLISSVVVETKAEPPGTELLPCPFCGSAAVLYEDAKGCMVVCQETNNPPCDIGNTHNDWTREAVIAMWNRRAGTKSFQPGGAPPCGERARLDNEKGQP